MNGAVHGDAMTTASTPESERIERADCATSSRRAATARSVAELEHAGQVEREHEEQQRERA